MRQNTHFFEGRDTIPSEGPLDLTLPLGSNPHRIRAEVRGDHVSLMYRDRGAGGWILIDEREFPAFGDGPRYVQFGFNLDSGSAGLVYVDNFSLSYRADVFEYINSFNNPTNSNPVEAWPELVDMSSATNIAAAQNDRIEWIGGSNGWLRLDMELPVEYIVEFDLFYQEGIIGRFSFWPLVGPDVTTVNVAPRREHYFLRQNTHYFPFRDEIPSEGPLDITLPLGSNPHRLRAEVNGDHISLMYRNQGEGGWILIDEREFPPFGDGPRYTQFGFHLDSGSAGLVYVDNLMVRGLGADRATANRTIGADTFEPETSFPVTIDVDVTGSIPLTYVIESYPRGWNISGISHDGRVIEDGTIQWALSNLEESITLTYTATPPRLIRSRVANFSGSIGPIGQGDRITGDTAISILLPYFYREAVDYNFSGSPVDGLNYPAESLLGVRYAQGLNGIPSDAAYSRPSANTPAPGAVYQFPTNADFRFGNPESGGFGGDYTFPGYRDEGEIRIESGSSDTRSNIGGITTGDWFRYTFDLGEGESVIMINLLLNAWNLGSTGVVDVYANNAFVGEILVPSVPANQFDMFSVGPVAVSGGVTDIVVAYPGPAAPQAFGRMEVISVEGIGQVSRQLTADGFFDPGDALEVTLNAEALYGAYTPYIEETLPPGVQVTDVSHGGQVSGGKLIWELGATTNNEVITYTIIPPDGVRFLIFDGYCDVGLPLARAIMGDTSVVNEVWIFGDGSGETQRDNFAGTALGAPWEMQYGNDPQLNVDYTEGANIRVSNGVLLFDLEALGQPGRFDEWSAGRRAPMVIWTDIPEGDFRIDTNMQLTDAFGWSQFHFGVVVAYNDNQATNVSGDQYLFGFHTSDLRVELTNVGVLGTLHYHQATSEIDWLIDVLDAGLAQANLGVTRRGDELIFSAQLANGPWQLVGAPVLETRQPQRIGLFGKMWGDIYAAAEFDFFSVTDLDPFVGVMDWALY